MPVIVSDDMWGAITATMGRMEPMGRTELCESCAHYRAVRDGGVRFCTRLSYIADERGYCAWSKPKEVKNDA